MRKHSKRKSTRSPHRSPKRASKRASKPAAQPAETTAQSSTNGSFLESIEALIGLQTLKELWKEHGPKPRGKKPTLSGPRLLIGLVYHLTSGPGTFAAHVKQLFGIKVTDGALSQRRTDAGLKVFAAVVATALKPLARLEEHPQAFYRGLRLTGMDGSQFSVGNTPQVLGRLSKAVARRLRAAFAKLPMSMLVELGTHHPLAVEVGVEQESELALSRRLIQRIQGGWLVLSDRLYGFGTFVNELLIHGQSVGSRFLARVRKDTKVTILQVLKDGSALIKVAVADGRGRKKRGSVIVREINGRVCRPNGKWVSVRLWTDLLDAKVYPATELLALYAQRWEIELFHRELKVDLRNVELLQSHTVETAAQEILALVLAMAVLSQQRLAAAAAGELPPLRISFAKTLTLVRSLWLVLAAAGDDLLSAQQIARLVDRMMKMIADQSIPERRHRTCPRAVRQPIKGWPRLTHNSYETGAFKYQVTPQAKI